MPSVQNLWDSINKNIRILELRMQYNTAVIYDLTQFEWQLHQATLFANKQESIIVNCQNAIRKLILLRCYIHQMDIIKAVTLHANFMDYSLDEFREQVHKNCTLFAVTTTLTPA